MTASKKTALQIRNLLRITNKYAVIGENEFRNKDAREYTLSYLELIYA